MSRQGQKYHSENKYQPSVADALKALDDKIHYKLYMLWANNPKCTLDDIATAIGRSKTTVSYYISETKHHKPPTSIRVLLSKFFDIPLYYLMEDDIDYTLDPKNCPRPPKFAGLPDQAIELMYLMPVRDTESYNMLMKQANMGMKLYEDVISGSGLSSDFVLSLTSAARMELTEKLKIVCNDIKADPTNNEALMEYKANMQDR